MAPDAPTGLFAGTDEPVAVDAAYARLTAKALEQTPQVWTVERVPFAACSERLTAICAAGGRIFEVFAVNPDLCGIAWWRWDE